MTVYSLAVEGVKNYSRNFAKLYVRVPIVERMEFKDLQPFLLSLKKSDNQIRNIFKLAPENQRHQKSSELFGN